MHGRLDEALPRDVATRRASFAATTAAATAATAAAVVAATHSEVMSAPGSTGRVRCTEKHQKVASLW
eukprot:6578-Heterococcus_DN1.PRE.4